ncbi:uncharacterized protein EI90DRAFT_3076548 [Cantharellus anzutake]|uniref:uncharacterized protein n=1 Tax=Cantharellus anzutake TaxID=1750568 RepID=UPI001908497D|nr:uncharacterized protein EI90DRAFT_3076548 [Cantharellus anzutake]KAF8323609.1 hypothetical protein EI90DRAFT_3076548 [Cantharellus anzutake]
MSPHDIPWHSDLAQRLASEADLQLDSSQWAAHVANEGIIEVLYDVSEPAEANHFIERVKQQLHILRDLRHENIVEFQGWTVQEDGNLFTVVAILGKCEGGEVMGFLRAHNGTDRQQLVFGVTVGLDFLHSKKVVHGSLNPVRCSLRLPCWVLLSNSLGSLEENFHRLYFRAPCR